MPGVLYLSWRLARGPALASGNKETKLVSESARAFLDSPADCGGNAAGVPVIAEDAAEGLKPEGIRKAAQHLLGTRLADDDDDNLSGELAHPLKEPRRRLAMMQWQIGNTRFLYWTRHILFEQYYTMEEMGETVRMVKSIDGGAKSGSGTIVRYSVALASLLGRPVVVDNVRAKRPKPGLRAQHLKVIQACQEMCRGMVSGAELGSRRIIYTPGERFRGGEYGWNIGTAGSTTMLAQTLMPLACFAEKPSRFRLEGGLFQDFAPSAYHMKFVLLPLLEQMGVRASLDIVRPGYVPRGAGIIEIEVQPVKKLKPLVLTEQGRVVDIRGIALSPHLREKGVSRRMAMECQRVLGSHGYRAGIREVYDTSSLQEGAALAIWADTSSNGRIGSDRAGMAARSSESIGRYVAQQLVQDLRSGAAVDEYVADQLVIYAALAGGTTRYTTPGITEHVETNLWLIAEFLGVRTKASGNIVEIEGIGFRG